MPAHHRRRLFGSFFLAVFALAICAFASAAETSKPQRLRAVDPSRLDWIVPGDTVHWEIRNWFGTPDTVIELDRGTTHWVYVDKWVATEKGVRAVQMARIEKRDRAASAVRFAENTKELGRAAGDLATNVSDWFGRNFAYPPKPLRRKRPDSTQLAAVSSKPKSTRDAEEVAEDVELIEEEVAPMIGYDEIDWSTNLARNELWVRFGADGVVADYGFQRAAGFPGKRAGDVPIKKSSAGEAPRNSSAPWDEAEPLYDQ